MSLDVPTTQFKISETNNGDEGTYQIRVYSQLDNYVQTTLSTTFIVQVNREYDFIVDQPPIWIPNLIDQRIENGESLQYRPEIEVIENGYEYNLKVRMNIAALFGSY